MKVGNLNKIINTISLIFFLFTPFNSYADNMEGYAATLGALDKITAKFSEFDINIGESEKFGSLNIKVLKYKNATDCFL